MKNSLEEVLEYRRERFEKSISIVKSKGEEYCGKQQSQGDSLFNYRIHFLLGWTDFQEEYPVERVLEKLQRFHSLLEQGVGYEKLEEEADDIHNILDYVCLMYKTRSKPNPVYQICNQCLKPTAIFPSNICKTCSEK